MGCRLGWSCGRNHTESAGYGQSCSVVSLGSRAFFLVQVGPLAKAAQSFRVDRCAADAARSMLVMHASYDRGGRSLMPEPSPTRQSQVECQEIPCGLLREGGILVLAGDLAERPSSEVSPGSAVDRSPGASARQGFEKTLSIERMRCEIKGK